MAVWHSWFGHQNQIENNKNWLSRKRRGQKESIKNHRKTKSRRRPTLNGSDDPTRGEIVILLPFYLSSYELLRLIYGRAAFRKKKTFKIGNDRRLLSTITNVRRSRKTIIISSSLDGELSVTSDQPAPTPGEYFSKEERKTLARNDPSETRLMLAKEKPNYTHSASYCCIRFSFGLSCLTQSQQIKDLENTKIRQKKV